MSWSGLNGAGFKAATGASGSSVSEAIPSDEGGSVMLVGMVSINAGAGVVGAMISGVLVAALDELSRPVDAVPGDGVLGAAMAVVVASIAAGVTAGDVGIGMACAGAVSTGTLDPVARFGKSVSIAATEGAVAEG